MGSDKGYDVSAAAAAVINYLITLQLYKLCTPKSFVNPSY